MSIFDKKNVFEVSETYEGFEDWLNKTYISSELKKNLSSSNVLFIPYENFRENIGPVFPECTEEIYQYLESKKSTGINVGLCIEDDDYCTIALHSALLIVGSFIVTSIVAPILVNVISDYIKEHSRSSSEDCDVRFEMTIVNIQDGKSLHVKYEGPEKCFREKVLPVTEDFKEKRPINKLDIYI